MRLDRHQIVRLDPSAWPALVEAHPAVKAMPAMREWVAALGRPPIARRPVCGDREGMAPLGLLPLPLSMGKERLTISVPPEAVMTWENPPLLSDAITIAPPAWHRTAAVLVEVDRDVLCFGSLAWDYLTGLISDMSDVDLLLLHRVVAALRAVMMGWSASVR